MRGKLVLLVLVVSAVILGVAGGAYAQGSSDKSVDVGDLFQWAQSSPPEWGKGALFAGLGLAGALVTTFGLVGGAVPGTAGSVRIDENNAQLERLTSRLEDLIKADPPNPPAISAVQGAVDNYRKDLRKEQWRLFAVAGFLYAILGAFFATLLAKDILQAIVIGAGWTGLAGTLGLKKDYESRKATKDEALDKAMDTIKELNQPDATLAAPAYEELTHSLNMAKAS